MSTTRASIDTASPFASWKPQHAAIRVPDSMLRLARGAHATGATKHRKITPNGLESLGQIILRATR
jgi:hypothetical protein